MINVVEKFRNLHAVEQLLILVALLNILDFQTTKIIIDQLGFGAELNPILRFMMEYFDSVYVILALKVVALTIPALAMYYFRGHPKYNPNKTLATMVLVVIGFWFIVVWNSFIVFTVI